MPSAHPPHLPLELALRLAVATCLLLVAAAAHAPSAILAAPSVKVMTYNVKWAEPVGKGTGGGGPINLSRIVHEVRSSGAEVVAFQEIHTYQVGGLYLSQAAAIAQALGWTDGGLYAHVYFRGGNPVSQWCRNPATGAPRVRTILNFGTGTCHAHGNAIITRHRIHSRSSVQLWRADGSPGNGDAFTETTGRRMLRAKISVAGRRLWVYATHLSPRSRVAACQMKYMISRGVGGRPAVFLGDFNLDTRAYVRAPHCRARIPARPMQMMGSAGFREMRIPPPTYPGHLVPRKRIDHIFMTRTLRATGLRRFDNCYRAPGEPREMCSSDHMPYYGTIHFATAARSRRAPTPNASAPVEQPPTVGSGLL